MKCAMAYLRCSGYSQVDGDTWARQEDKIRRCADSLSLSLVGLFRESAVPGKTEAEDRDAFQEMVRAMLRGDCRIVIVEDLSRLAREYRVQEQLLIYLASKDISIISANTGENVTEAMMGDPMRRALVQIQGVLAELEKNMIVSRTRAARQRVKANGFRAEGVAPYGYRIEGKKGEKRLVVDNHEQGVIEHIRGARRNGLGLENIASQLNHIGIKPRRGKKWYPQQVQRILLRPINTLP